MTEPITVEFTLREDQYLQFSMAYLWRIWIWRPGGLFILLMLGVLTVLGTRQSVLHGVGPIQLITFLLIASVCLTIPLSTLWKARRHYRIALRPANPQRWIVSDDGIRQEVTGGTSEIAWSRFVKVRWLGSSWFFMTSFTTGILLPSGAVAEEDRMRLTSLIDENVRERI